MAILATLFQLGDPRFRIAASGSPHLVDKRSSPSTFLWHQSPGYDQAIPVDVIDHVAAAGPRKYTTRLLTHLSKIEVLNQFTNRSPKMALSRVRVVLWF